MTPRARRLAAGLDSLGRGATAQEVARTAALDERLSRALVSAQPGDARAVLERLLDVDARLRAHEQQLRLAFTWPATTLVLVGLAALVLATVAAPALRQLPAGASLSPALLALPFVLSGLAFAALALAMAKRWPLAGITVWRALEGWCFAAVAGALVRAGAPLGAAMRAGAEVCTGERRAGALGLARELEAGALRAATSAPLLGVLGARLFVVAAPAGAAVATLDALVTLGDASLEREVRHDAQRLGTWGLLLAAGAFLATAALFYLAYLKAAGA